MNSKFGGLIWGRRRDNMNKKPPVVLMGGWFGFRPHPPQIRQLISSCSCKIAVLYLGGATLSNNSRGILWSASSRVGSAVLKLGRKVISLLLLLQGNRGRRRGSRIYIVPHACRHAFTLCLNFSLRIHVRGKVTHVMRETGG